MLKLDQKIYNTQTIIFLILFSCILFLRHFCEKREYKSQVHKKKPYKTKKKIIKRRKNVRISRNIIDLCTSMIHLISILFTCRT
jgi:5'-3' exonuclease